MPNKLKGLLSSIMAELKQIAASETIVGKPVAIGDKSIVPVTRVMVGFGVGGGEGESDEKGQGFGGGGAGGARVEPVGFIIIGEDKVSFLPTKPGKFEGLIDAIPDLLDKVKGLKKEKSLTEDKPKKK
jgi:uncharacterized spore protein YtfJ